MAFDKNNYSIYGVKVNEETYRKYTEQRYRFGNGEYSLSDLHTWATSEDLAVAYPETAREAREIYDQMMSDINASRNTAKYYARNKNFIGFVDDLDEIFTENRKKYTALHEAWEKAQKNYRDAAGGDETVRTVARADYLTAEQTFTQGIKALREKHKTQITALRTALNDFALSLYRATPDRLDSAAIQLMDSGIMKASDYEYMTNQYRDNPIMLQIIAQRVKEYADKEHKQGNMESGKRANMLAASLRIANDYSKALEPFNTLAKESESGLSNDAKYAAAWSRHWSDLCETARNSYKAFIIQP